MKISGFTIIKNAIIMDYPIVEAIQSILPVVDEMIVLVGDCDDDTEGLIRNIGSDKIKIHHSVWNPALRKGGEALADETNKAFQLIDPNADWAFYIQGDEVVHEKYLPVIKEACEKYAADKRVLGLLFKYLHFYGTYDFVGDSRRWYNREIRIIRNDKSITAYRDAQGFRQGRKKLPVKEIDAYVYHYGWVKSPKKMREKQKQAARYWNTDDELKPFIESSDVFNFDDFDSLQKFTGTHPAVMQKRVAEMTWQVDIDPSKKQFSFKDRILHYIELKTGKRLFDFKNYRKI
jgi:hypothetical protein